VRRTTKHNLKEGFLKLKEEHLRKKRGRFKESYVKSGSNNIPLQKGVFFSRYFAYGND
jgi:hypothetical protein